MLRSRYQSWLLPYLEGSLDTEKKVLLEARLARDPALAAEAEQLRQTITALRLSAAEQAPPTTSGYSAWPSVRARIEQTQPRQSSSQLWWWGGLCAGGAAAACVVIALSGHPTAQQIPKPIPMASLASPAQKMASSKLSDSTNTPTPAPMAAKPMIMAKKPVGLSVPKAASPKMAVAIPRRKELQPKTSSDPFAVPAPKHGTTQIAQVSHDVLKPPASFSGALSKPMDMRAAPLAQSAVPPFTSVPVRHDKDLPTPILPGGEPSDTGNMQSEATPPTATRIIVPVPVMNSPAPSAAASSAIGSVNDQSATGVTENRTGSNVFALVPGQIPLMQRKVFADATTNGNSVVVMDGWVMQMRNTVRNSVYGSDTSAKKLTALFDSVRSQGYLENLRVTLEQHQERQPKDLVTHRLLAAFYAYNGNADLALTVWRETVLLVGVTGEDWFQLGQAEEQSGNHDAARTAYFHALQVSGLNNTAHRDQIRHFLTDPLPNNR